MAELEFYRDSRGNPCARGDDKRLATFLETDLQESVSVTKELINLLENSEERVEFNGNGHCVTISAVLVTIESNFDDEAPDRRMSREDMLVNVKRWLKFID